jgi:RNA recognition motif-containing protein
MQRDLNLDAPLDEPRLDAIELKGHRMGIAPAGRSDNTRSVRPSKKRPNGDRPARSGNGTRGAKNRTDGDRTEQNDRRDADRTPARKSNGNGGATKSVYIANIPWRMTDSDVRTMFKKHGAVHNATVITDRKTGRSRGFGFVEMPASAAATAVKELHGSNVEGRDLIVRLADPKKRR